jgi:EcsC protein family
MRKSSNMAVTDGNDPTVFSKAVRGALRLGFRRAYPRVQVDAEKFLHHARRAYNLPIESWRDMHSLDEQTIIPAAEKIIWSSARMAALEGMGLGIGGMATLLPDMGILAAITIRMLQKLSLIHGFEYSTSDEMAALWLAAATAAGLDFTREFVEKRAIEHLVPRLVDAMAVKVGAEVAEKWAGRVIPLVGAGAAAALNYYFVRSWGKRAHLHFLEKHRAVRGHLFAERAFLPAPTH